MQNAKAEEKLSAQLFSMEPKIRYVAVNRKGKIVEMEQSPSHPSYNPNETDRMEELIVNPIVLDLAARRGNLDMDGIRYVVIRYGTQVSTFDPLRRRPPFDWRGTAGRSREDCFQDHRSPEIAALSGTRRTKYHARSW